MGAKFSFFEQDFEVIPEEFTVAVSDIAVLDSGKYTIVIEKANQKCIFMKAYSTDLRQNVIDA